MTTSQIAGYTLNIVALLLQLLGAALVALDVKQAQDNTTRFKRALDDAARTRHDHISNMGRSPTRRRSPLGGSIQMPKLPSEARAQIADQLGPSAMEERKALTEFVSNQYEISKTRRWAGVLLLVLGFTVGFTANIVVI